MYILYNHQIKEVIKVFFEEITGGSQTPGKMNHGEGIQKFL
jgi:hypothetical protein